MTFILGLVAEPVPAKYVNTPARTGLAEVKGRQVLDKFNCAGCHQVQPGSLRVQADASDPVGAEDFAQDGETVKEPVTADHLFAEPSNAWVGTNPLTDERTGCAGHAQSDAEPVKAYGVDRPARRLSTTKPASPDATTSSCRLRLTRALRFRTMDGRRKYGTSRPAASVLMPAATTSPASSSSSGGDRSAARSPTCLSRTSQANPQKLRPSTAQRDDKARAAVPPPLVREGEKVAAGLAVPASCATRSRSGRSTVLRMPKFNMSERGRAGAGQLLRRRRARSPTPASA